MRIRRRDFVFRVGILKAEIVQRVVTQDEGMADDRGLPRHGKVETRTRRRTAAGRDDRPVLVFGAEAKEQALPGSELMVDFTVIRPSSLCALKGSLVLWPDAARIYREELIFPRSFIGEEEVCSVPEDRTTDCPTVLISPIIRFDSLKELLRSDRCVPGSRSSAG